MSDLLRSGGKTAMPWVIFLFVMLVGMQLYPGGVSGKLALDVNNSAHPPFFLLVTIITNKAIRAITGPGSALAWQRYATLAAFVGTMAFATEAVQFWTSRDADIQDVASNIAGGIAGLLWILGGELKDRIGWIKANGLRVSGTLILLLSTYSGIAALTAYVYREYRAPTIFESGMPYQKYFIQLQNSVLEDTRSGESFPEFAMTVRFLDKPWPGVSFFPFSDWRPYSTLLIKITAEQSEGATLFLRIDDARHNGQYNDRFNSTLTLHPGQNLFRLNLVDISHGPKGRRLDLSSISRIVLFGKQSDHPKGFSLERIWLE